MGIASSHFQTCRFLRKSSIFLMDIVQRLFSTFCRWMAGCRSSSSAFAHGAALIAFGISGISEPPPSAVAPQIIGIAAAIFLLVGGSRRWLGYWRLLLKCGSQ